MRAISAPASSLIGRSCKMHILLKLTIAAWFWLMLGLSFPFDSNWRLCALLISALFMLAFLVILTYKHRITDV